MVVCQKRGIGKLPLKAALAHAVRIATVGKDAYARTQLEVALWMAHKTPRRHLAQVNGAVLRGDNDRSLAATAYRALGALLAQPAQTANSGDAVAHIATQGATDAKVTVTALKTLLEASHKIGLVLFARQLNHGADGVFGLSPWQ